MTAESATDVAARVLDASARWSSVYDQMDRADNPETYEPLLTAQMAARREYDQLALQYAPLLAHALGD